ncbi:MAG: TPM domain-containing protein [Clostridia bacterium]|nr:TPM domain-containing protein [Clostridia bacterium]
MNKKIFAFIIAALMCVMCSLSSFAAQIDADTDFIIDEIGYLDADELTTLNAEAYNAYKECGVAVFVVFTYYDLDANSADYYIGDVDDYVLMIENEEYYAVFTGGTADDKIDDSVADDLRDAYDAEETFEAGISAFIEESAGLFDQTTTGDVGDAYVPESEGIRLYDGADLLTDTEEADLIAKLDKVSGEYNVDVAVATVDGTGDMNATEYVNYYFDKSGLGVGESLDAVLLLIDMDAREFRILSNGDLGAAAVSSGDIDNITDMITSDLSDAYYYDAFSAYVDEVEYQLNGEINGFPFKTTRNIVISLVIGFVVAFIVTGSMKSKLKSVSKKTNAASYVKQGSLMLQDSRDNFLYSHITKTKRESKSDSSSNSGGSSRNVGGGKF